FARDVAFLGRGHRLPPELRLRLSQLYALGMLPSVAMVSYSSRLLASLLGGAEQVLDRVISLLDLFDTTSFCLYDILTPNHQFRHSRLEVLTWLRSLGFTACGTDGSGTYWGRIRRRERRCRGASASAVFSTR